MLCAETPVQLAAMVCSVPHEYRCPSLRGGPARKDALRDATAAKRDARAEQASESKPAAQSGRAQQREKLLRAGTRTRADMYGQSGGAGGEAVVDVLYQCHMYASVSESPAQRDETAHRPLTPQSVLPRTCPGANRRAGFGCLRSGVFFAPDSVSPRSESPSRARSILHTTPCLAGSLDVRARRPLFSSLHSSLNTHPLPLDTQEKRRLDDNHGDQPVDSIASIAAHSENRVRFGCSTACCEPPLFQDARAPTTTALVAYKPLA